MSSMATMPIPHAENDADALVGGAVGVGTGDPDDVPDLSTVWLRVFLEVARHGSFTVAGRVLGWTQSAVSRQVASLEAALGGTPLFDRLPRGVRLTGAGRSLVPHAEAVTARLRDAGRELASLREAASGRVRVGAFPTADAALVPRAIAAFRARHPGVRLTREEGLTPALLDGLTAGDLDLAVVSTTGRAPLDAHELHHLLDESLYVAVPAAHPLRASPRSSCPDSPTRTGYPAAPAPRAPSWTRHCGTVSARAWHTSSPSGRPSRGTWPPVSG